MRRRQARAAPGLDARLASLATFVERASGRVPDGQLGASRALLERAAERRALAPGVTVAALVGATGSGKSSLLNAVAGAPVAPVDVRRPTTTAPLSVSWDAPGAVALLDWLEVPERHEASARGVSGLVLLDLPDIDSTTTGNREVATRLAQRVDALVWVLDPQKYADAVVHEEYLRTMHEHAAVSVVVLNQVDRLQPAEAAEVTGHLRALLAQDGMAEVTVLETSAATGDGVGQLRRRLADVAAAGLSAEHRLAADVRAAATDLQGWSAPGEVRAQVPEGDEQDLVEACAQAAGAETVADAVALGYRRRAVRHVGWPPTRWLARLRPDPLRRLHLDRPSTAVTSLPGPTPAQGAAVRTAVEDLAHRTTSGMAERWRSDVLAAAADRVPGLVDRLDAAVAGTDLGAGRRPRWWQVWRVLGLALFLVALGGAGWLGTLAVLGYLQLPEPQTPAVGPLPWPTVLLLGGLGLGVLLAALGRLLARAGARRAARAARRRLAAAVRDTVHEAAVAPLDAELARYRDLDQALRTAGY